MSNRSNSRNARGDQESPDNLNTLLNHGEDGGREGFLGLNVEHDEYTEEQRRKVKARRRNTMLTATLVFSVALIMIVAILSPQMGWFKRKDFRGDGNGTAVTYTVDQGDTAYKIANDLESKGVIADANRFVENFQEQAGEQFIQPGQYSLQEQMSSESAIHILLQKDKENQNYLAINQNWRMDETFDAIAKATGKNVGELQALNSDVSKFGIPAKFPSLEGWLHPGEYHFDKNASSEEIIQTMVDRTKADLNEAGVQGDDQIFHVVTVASILEFEGIPKDYDPIAGAIENRMNNPEGETGGFLQSDATVAYGLGEKTYQLTTEQKQDKNNKYNTFAHPGLPVGPIGSPTLDAIKSAAHPQKNDYYFWVTVNLDTGETKFAKTYAEHQQNVAEYEQWCSKNEGKCS